VLAVDADHLMSEALRPDCPDEPEFWEQAGRAVAGLHGTVGDRFGWSEHGWLGLLPQHNTWCADGHRFFAEHRLLRYVVEPKADALLSPEDRVALERLCARLPELVPSTPAVLTHGDLWRNNIVCGPSGAPAFIDPAVSFTWAEVDLSMLYCSPGASPRFFAAYQEVRPLEPGWRDRTPLLYLRELLSALAHEGDRWGSLGQIRAIIRPFRTVVSSS
jgi:fructosamine-3-kinase